MKSNHLCSSLVQMKFCSNSPKMLPCNTWKLYLCYLQHFRNQHRWSWSSIMQKEAGLHICSHRAWMLNLFSCTSDSSCGMMHYSSSEQRIPTGRNICSEIKIKKPLTVNWVSNYGMAQIQFSNCTGINCRREALILVRIKDHNLIRSVTFCKDKWQGKFRKVQMSSYSNDKAAYSLMGFISLLERTKTPSLPNP